MCFKRKASLGQYNGTREEWLCAYRKARSEKRSGLEPNPTYSGVMWKASLITWYERNELNDPLAIPIAARFGADRLIDEILGVSNA